MFNQLLQTTNSVKKCRLKMWICGSRSRFQSVIFSLCFGQSNSVCQFQLVFCSIFQSWTINKLVNFITLVSQFEAFSVIQ